LFARLREIAGAPDVKLDLPDEARVGDAWTVLAGKHPELKAYERSISCAVNEDYARMSAVLHDGDEVAFLPPVSGG
jgi:molybdopterin converting factor subunit 1